MLRVQKVRLRFLRDPIADQLPVPNGRRCNERGWKLVLGFDSIRNLFRIDRRRKEREMASTSPADSAPTAFFLVVEPMPMGPSCTLGSTRTRRLRGLQLLCASDTHSSA